MLVLPPIPADLKCVGPFCTRAQEVRARDPIVSYWCLFYVAQLGVKRGKTPENQAFLNGVLEQLETMKRSLKHRRQIADEAAGSLYVRRFGYNVFNAATNEDAQGQANRSTAKKFLAASYFLETLRVFGHLDAEVEETIKYARSKANDIVRILREGAPASGAPAHPPGRATPNGYVVSPSALSPQTNSVLLSGRPSTFASPAESPTGAGRKAFSYPQANYLPPPTDAGSGSPVSPRNVQPPAPMFVNPRRQAQAQEIAKPENVALPSSGSSGQIPLPEPTSPRKLQSPVRERSPLAYMGPTAARNAAQNAPKPPSPPPKPPTPVIKPPSPVVKYPSPKPPSPKPASPIKAPVPVPVTSPVIQQSPEEWPASSIVLTRPPGPTEWPSHALASPSMGSTMTTDSAETFTSSQLHTVIKGPSAAPRATSPVKSESAASTEQESDSEATETEDESEEESDGDDDDDDDESVAESTLMPVLTVVDDPAPKLEIPGAQTSGLVAVASPAVDDWGFAREMTEAIGKLTRTPAHFSASPLSASQSSSRASPELASHGSPLSLASETPMPQSPDLEANGITPAVVVPQSPVQPSPTTPNMRAYSPPTISPVSLHQPQPFKSAAEVIDFSFSKFNRGQEPESVDVEDDEDGGSSFSSFSGSEDEAEDEEAEEDSESSDGSSISEMTIQESEAKPQELKSRIRGANGEPTRKTVRFAPSVVGGLSPEVPRQILPPPSSSSPPLQIVPASAVPQPLVRPRNLTIRSSSYDNYQPARSPDSPMHGPARAATLDDFTIIPYHPSMSASHPPPVLHNNPAYAPTANNALVRTTWSPSSPTQGPSIPPHRVQIDRETASLAQKYSRFAISSLNYMDIEAAKKELRAALTLLEGGDMY